MKTINIILAAMVFIISGCDNRVEADAARQAELKDMYRVPAPSKPVEDQWAKPGTTKPKPKGQ
jgi:uncharacterized lipoprotein NlpE involved in copper resistance